MPYGLLVGLSKHCKSSRIDLDLMRQRGCKVKYCLHAEEHFSVSQFFNDKLHVTTKCNDLCSKCGTPLNGRENLKSRHSLLSAARSNTRTAHYRRQIKREREKDKALFIHSRGFSSLYNASLVKIRRF